MEMIKGGFAIFKKHWKFIILAGIATAVINAILQLLQDGITRGGNGLVIFIVSLFAVLVGIIIALGWAKVFFKTKPVVWSQTIRALLWYVLYFILYAIPAVLPGIALFGIAKAAGLAILVPIGAILIVVGIAAVALYFGIKYQFIKFVVLDHPELSPKEIFKKAGNITQGSFWKLVGFGVTLFFVNVLGLICLFVGLIVTIPTTKIAQAKVYEHLKTKLGSL
jgi:hypothetical protein